MHHIGMSTAPTLYADLAYDPLEGFATVGLVTEVPMTIIARKDFEPNTLAELVDYVKANEDTVTYANAGIGAASHLCGLLFMDAIGTQLTKVPYQGTGPAMTDLIGGQVDFMCDQTTNTTGQIQGGEVKAYAVTSPERLAALPDLPTTAEGGLPDVNVGVWHGLYAPAGTPDEVVQKLTAALQAALQDQNVIDRFAELGTTPVPQELATPEAHRELPRGADRAVAADHRGGGRRWRSRPARPGRADRPGASPGCRGGKAGMQRLRSVKDLLAGLIFVGFGLAFGYAASATTSARRCAWDRATSRLVLAGAARVARRRHRGQVASRATGADADRPRARGARIVLILGAILFFGATVRGLGLVAVALRHRFTAAPMPAGRPARSGALVMAAGLTLFCVLIFVWGLGLPMALFGPWLGF